MPKKTIVIIEALLAVIIWGASFIATKIALRDVFPVTVVWLRFGMGVIILGATVQFRRQLALPGWRDIAYFAFLGFLGIAFHQWIQTTGLETAQASTSAWIVSTAPIFIAILGWIFLKEKLTLAQVGGIGLAAVGVMLVVSKGNLPSLIGGSAISFGDILIMISALNWAVFSILSRKGLQAHSAALMMFYVMAAGWLLTSIQFFAGPWRIQIQQLTINGWLGVGFLGIFCTGLAYIFWYDALKLLPASQAGVFLFIEPLITAVAASVILNEPLLIMTLIGGSTILLGVWIVNRNGKKPVIEDQSAEKGSQLTQV